MKEALGVVVVENLDGHIEHAVELGIELIHDERADFLMVHPIDNAVLQRVAEGAMPHIVEKDGQTRSSVLLFGDDNALFPQGIQCLLHEKQGAYSMVEAVVDRAGVYQMAQAELADSAKPLYPRMIKYLREIRVSQLNESINWIVEQLGTCGHGRNLVSLFAPASPE